MVNIGIHWLLELFGSGTWACLRGRCDHKKHRIIGDIIICGIMSYATVSTIG